MATGITTPPDPDTWHPARLIPTAGIKGQEEQERRATSCLLAVAAAVPEFGRALFAEAGAPRGRIATFTEVQLKDPDGKLSISDGVAVVERGKTTWRCLIEVKTSNAPLKPEQVNRYLDMARQHNFDAVLTISNQITASPQECPIDVDKRKTRSVDLRHLSWWRIVTEAVVQHRHRGCGVRKFDRAAIRSVSRGGRVCAPHRAPRPALSGIRPSSGRFVARPGAPGRPSHAGCLSAAGARVGEQPRRTCPPTGASDQG